VPSLRPPHRLAPLLLGLAALALPGIAAAPAAAAAAAPAPRTPAGWLVRPAGRQIAAPALTPGFQGPLGSAISPSGRQLLSASSGAARFDSVDLFDLGAAQRTSLVAYDATKGLGEAVFYGVVFSPTGRRAWASGGGQNVVHAYTVANGLLHETGQIATPYFPAGLAYAHTPRGDRIYVANNLSGPAIAENPPGGRVTVIDPHTNRVTNTIQLGIHRAPLGVAFERHGRKAYVTNWLDRSVSVINTRRERRGRRIVLSPIERPMKADHPSAVVGNPRRDELYTANANSDTVSVIDTRRDRLAATIPVGLVGGGPKGGSPSGLDVSPNGRTLYVALSGENALAVVDLRRRRTVGFVPTAWAPVDVDVIPRGPRKGRVVVTNTNGVGSAANPCGPRSPLPGCLPTGPDDPNHEGEAGQTKSMSRGSLSVIRPPRSRAGLRRTTAAVRSNNQAPARRRSKPAYLRAIRHVIYVVKENRTYDQILGDLGKGDGDPRLTIFGEGSAPNQHELARRFVLFDNFFADAEVSADGHNWVTQANSTDYVEKTWPITYSPDPRGRQRVRDYEDVPFTQRFGSEPLAGDPDIPRAAAAQTAGYIWDDAYAHGVSYRDYGEYTTIPGDCFGAGNSSLTTHLDDRRYGDHVDESFPGYNLDCSDHAQREPEWEREFLAYDADHRANPASDRLPALQIVRFPNDHTAGTRPGKATPQAYMADNDLALGRLVDAVSHSSYWKSTLILVTEDDAQDGPDHVDAHRTLALAISPYTQTGAVDSTRYDTGALIATMEDLLRLPPMSIVDQRATRLWAAFSPEARLDPYSALMPSVTPFGEPGVAVNGPRAPLAAAARKWNLRDADATPEVPLNEAIWKSVKGSGSRMPRPRHDLIVGSRPVDGDG
jgi:YVTN family beta-propeller protein